MSAVKLATWPSHPFGKWPPHKVKRFYCAKINRCNQINVANLKFVSFCNQTKKRPVLGALSQKISFNCLSQRLGLGVFSLALPDDTNNRVKKFCRGQIWIISL